MIPRLPQPYSPCVPRRLFWLVGFFLAYALMASATPPPFDSHRRSEWKPDRVTEVYAAPAPANADAEALRFAERNKSENLKRLADEFFAMIDEEALPDVYRLYRKAQYAEALTAFRDDFIKRLRQGQEPFPFQPKHPSVPGFIQFLNEPEELMRNVVTLGVTDPEHKDTITLKLDIGAPGRSNYFHLPGNYVYWRLRGLRNITNPAGAEIDKHPLPLIYYEPGFFGELLTAYADTGEVRYLAKWCEFSDAQYEVLKPQMTAAGVYLNPDNRAEQYTSDIIPYFCYLARSRESFAQQLPPATLARLLLRFVKEELAGVMLCARHTIPNRVEEMYSAHGEKVGVAFPALKPFLYAMRDSRRVREMQAVMGLMPDGGDIEQSFNYSSCYPSMTKEMLANYAEAPFATREWLQERVDGARARTDFLMRFRAPTGGYLFQEQLARRDFSTPDGIFTRWGSRTGDQVLSAVWGDGSFGEPPYRSEAFPYSGFYVLRQGWDKQDQTLSLAACRPVVKNFPYMMHVNLQAYGRCMLLPGMLRSGPVEVDGLRQNGRSFVPELLPAEQRGWKGEPFAARYERGCSATAWQTPLKNRWLDGNGFSLCEGYYDGPYLHVPKEQTSYRIVKDVVHHRVAIFLRDMRNWLILDRLSSGAPHKYTVLWPLYFGDKTATAWPGFQPEGIRQTPAEHLMAQTTDLKGANLAIYSVASGPLVPQKWGCLVTGKAGDTLVGSLLHPLPSGTDKGVQVRPLKDAPLAFSAETTDGGLATVLASDNPLPLTVGRVKATAKLLVVTQKPGGAPPQYLILDCDNLTVDEKPAALPARNFACTLTAKGIEQVQPILTPLDRVEISPATDVFTDKIDVTLAHPAKDEVDIRYTLDGSEPTISSCLYASPIPLGNTAMVKARAFRKGVKETPIPLSGDFASATMHAVYTKKKSLPATKLAGEVQPGLISRYFEEGNWPMTPLSQPGTPVSATGRVTELFDTSARRNTIGFAFEYAGYLKIAQDGVYSFRAPRELTTPAVDAAYDLRVFVDGQEWYPSTRLHNYGVWSLPLQQGYHAFRVVFIDMRQTRQIPLAHVEDRVWDGTRPDLRLSGPGLPEGPIPAAMLCMGAPPRPNYPRSQTGQTTADLDLPQLETRHIATPTPDGTLFLPTRDCLVLKAETTDFAKPGAKNPDTANYDPSVNVIGYWGQHGNLLDYLCWGVDLPKAGEYLVKITYRVNYPDSKVRIECADQFFDWAVPLQSFRFGQKTVGVIKLPAGRHVLRMRGISIANKWSFLDPREIELQAYQP